MGSLGQRIGSIIQLCCVIAFVLGSAHVAPIRMAHEATSIAPIVETGASYESKLVSTPDVLDSPLAISSPESGTILAYALFVDPSYHQANTLKPLVLRV